MYQGDPPELSVVILCYRSEDYAPKFVADMKRALESLEISYELVLVANYHRDASSLDRTPEIVRELGRHDSRITVVAREKQGMMGWDMRSGLEAASGRTIAVIDGDGQMPPEDVLRVYRKLRSGSYDMAKTYREERKDGLVRILISRVFNFLLKVLFPKVRIRDVNSKPKILTREALQKLRLSADDWFADAEIVIRAAALGLRIGEVPTVFYPNPRRPSFLKPRAILEFLVNLIKYRYRMLKKM